MAVMLSYFSTFFDLLNIGYLSRESGLPLIIVLVAVVAQGAGAVGIANDRKVGYAIAIGGASMMALISVLVVFSVGIGLSLIGLMFAGALLTLLVHEQSRNHARIWFE